MNQGRPVYWHEGVFLRPQHFQQQDDFHDTKLYALFSTRQPFFWGVKSLAISPGALKDQIFEVTECELLFQDGTLIRYPGNGRTKARSFEGFWDPTGKPLSVHIGLRKLTPDGVNVSLPTEGSETGFGERDGVRFSVSDADAPTKDLYARDPGQPVLYLEYNLRVFFDKEAEEATDYHLIKVAEIERIGSEIRAVNTYVPPTLTVEASPYLLGVLREIKEQLTARGHELAQYKHGKGIEAPDLGSRDLLYLLGLMTLNRWIPLMHHCLEVHTLAPWDAYALLRQIAGELSTFSTRYDVFGAAGGALGAEGLPEYRHRDLRACFSEAQRAISRLLEELTAGPDFVVPLLFDGTYYYADVPERIFQGTNRYYLCVRSESDVEQLISTLQTIAKMSSKEYLPILIARALPGVPLEYLTSLPSELPRRPNSIYFSVDPHGPAWDAIRDNLNVAIYFETIPAEIEIELMVIYGK